MESGVEKEDIKKYGKQTKQLFEIYFVSSD